MQSRSLARGPSATKNAEAVGVTDGAMMRIAVVWFVVVALVGLNGVFLEYTRILSVFVMTPVIAFIIAFVVSPQVRAWAWSLDPQVFVLFNSARFAGMAFLVLHAHGQLNGKFALSAGWMDVAVAVTAPLVAFYLMPARTATQRRLLAAWMAFGVADFVIAIPMGILARLDDPASMIALNKFPLVIVPTYFVPLILIGYFVVFTQLWRESGGARQAEPSPSPIQPRGPI